MLDFIYYAPTKVFFGKGKENSVGEIISSYGFKKIMLQYGKGSIKVGGLYDRIMASLKAADIEVVEFGGVEPNPKLNFIRDAVKTAKQEKVELILAVGGGSVIDASKLTAIGAKNDFDVWDLPTGKNKPIGALPVGCILTLAAAGSEMSASAVMTNTEENLKCGFGSDYNRPLFTICNPELTYTVNKYHTACGITDILAHTMERYFFPCDDTPLTDSVAEAVLKSVIDAGRILMKDPENYEARATAMWGSSLSHNGLTGCGRSNALAVHQLEHALSGEFDHIAHGAGLAVLFPAWARFVYKENIPRFAQFARKVWGVNEADDEAAAVLGIEAMEKFFTELSMPLKLREFGIENCPERLANLATFNKTRVINSYVLLNFENIKKIFESCY
ncbi:MAG: iron-containing alcohol dehydrogenase [Ruminococcaceae bacterium]|nr:iron-containing alcohol dehydrogenase [Oscillospiraceae bacterium]